MLYIFSLSSFSAGRSSSLFESLHQTVSFCQREIFVSFRRFPWFIPFTVLFPWFMSFISLPSPPCKLHFSLAVSQSSSSCFSITTAFITSRECISLNNILPLMDRISWLVFMTESSRTFYLFISNKYLLSSSLLSVMWSDVRAKRLLASVYLCNIKVTNYTNQ